MTLERMKQIMVEEMTAMLGAFHEEHPIHMALESAAKRIRHELRPAYIPSTAKVYYPTPACDCGAVRAKTSKHANWCQLVIPRR